MVYAKPARLRFSICQTEPKKNTTTGTAMQCNAMDFSCLTPTTQRMELYQQRWEKEAMGGVFFFFEEKLEGHWVASVDPPLSPL